MNLIHVEDAADIVVAAERSQRAASGPRIYCVSDGAAGRNVAKYYSEVARQIGAPPPGLSSLNPTHRRAARSESNRRVSATTE